MPFVASLVVKAWRESSDDDVEVILSGLSPLKDEIEWFKRESNKWGVDLDHLVPMTQNHDYCRYYSLPNIIFTLLLDAI